MERLIGTLPITPKKDAPVGFYLSPYLVDVLSMMTGSKGLVLINNLGLKANSSHGKQNLTSFQTNLNSLTGLPSLMDSEAPHLNSIPGYVDQCISHGMIVKESIDKTICDCGAVDIPSYVANELARTNRGGKTYFVKDNSLYCSLCRTEATPKENCDVLSLQFSDIDLSDQGLKIFPAKYTKEFNNSILGIIKQKWLITRLRETGVNCDTEFGKYNLDIDFVWSLMNATLANINVPIANLVISHRSIMPASRFLVLSSSLDVNLDRVIVLPFMHIRQGDNKVPFNDNIDWLSGRYNTKIIRFLLALGFRKNKEVTLNSTVLYWISHSSEDTKDKFKGDIEHRSLDSTLDFLFSGGTDKLISYLRKNPQRGPSDFKYLLSLYRAINKTIWELKNDRK